MVSGKYNQVKIFHWNWYFLKNETVKIFKWWNNIITIYTTDIIWIFNIRKEIKFVYID